MLVTKCAVFYFMQANIQERVIERPLTMLERRLLTYSSLKVAFRVSPVTFTPKLKTHGK